MINGRDCEYYNCREKKLFMTDVETIFLSKQKQKHQHSYVNISFLLLVPVSVHSPAVSLLAPH